METTRVNWGYIGIMEKKMETTTVITALWVTLEALADLLLT